jgi:hypothetical protein
LHRQPEHLQKQHPYQDDQVAIAAEDGFHNTSFEFLVSSFKTISVGHQTPSKPET